MIFVVKPEGKRQLGKRRSTWVYNIEEDFRIDWIDLAKGSD
jgi:hypothetical protein